MYFQPRQADSQLPEMFSSAEWEAIAVHAGLTKRQQQVARYLCLGYRNAEIAQALLISRITVRMHVRALFRRLRVRDRIWVPVKLILLFRDLQMNGVNAYVFRKSVADSGQSQCAELEENRTGMKANRFDGRLLRPVSR